MKTHLNTRHARTGRPVWPLLLGAALISVNPPVSTVGAAEPEAATNVSAQIDSARKSPVVEESAAVAIKSMHPIHDDPFMAGQAFAEPREVAWLGVATDEAPEVLTLQMNLGPGVGLAVTFVAEDSPAAKAGLERNDVLVAFDDQALVLPAQLRKLVQSREEGDTVLLTFYRNGKQQTAEVSLGKSQLGPWGDAEAWKEQLRGLEKQWQDVNLGEAFREPLAQMQESLGDLKLNQREFQDQIRHAMEQARHAANNPEVREQIKRAMQEARQAMEQARGAMSGITVPSVPGEPGHVGAHTPKVTVRSSGNSAQSMVVADETGTYVIVRNPRLRLMAHDSEGNLLFDGEIETKEQRETVAPELWQKVKPLVDKLSAHGQHAGPGPLPAPPPPPTPGPAPPHGTI